MKVAMKVVDKSVANLSFKPCQAISCIHNINGTCALKKCELYERLLIQEH